VLIPFLGPVLMAALLVRLFRPASPGDFWLVQGLGLLQVALACVLADTTLFGLLLLLYLVTALSALAAHERRTLALHGPGATLEAAPGERPTTLTFGLRWLAGAAVLAGPLFLLTPRSEEAPWDPMRRFGMQPERREGAQTGFSEEIDLLRTGVLVRDDSPAFSVQVTDPSGRPERALPPDPRWRGIVLDRYEEGLWRSGLTWSSGGPRFNVRWHPCEGPSLLLNFRVPRQTGGLFLAEPIGLGSRPGLLPVRAAPMPGRHPPLFYEAGGTALAISYLTETEYRYVQSIPREPGRVRCPAVRVAERYQASLLKCHAPGVEELTVALLERLARQAPAPDARLLAALERRRRWGADLPPIFWEPVGRMLADHLARSGEYTYSLQIARKVMRLDPVVDFLVNVKEGHCERYASALALMLRSLGVPARIVKGFRGADYLGEGKYQVRNSHAHAWVEALVPAQGGPGYDWLLLDPTPETEAPALSALTRLQQNGEVLWRDLILGYGSGDQAGLWEDLGSGQLLASAAPLLGAAALGAAFVWLVRRQRRLRRRVATATQAGPLLDRLCRLLERHADLRRSHGETPAELAERAALALAAREATAAVRDVPAAVVSAFYRARYGGQPASEAHLRDLSGRLDALAAALRH
jgi:hypothetical protein